jgi:Family of unknown function (DUF6493)
MNIDAVQQAILNKDADSVVAAVAKWNEKERSEAIAPLNLLMLALGFDRHVTSPCDLQLDSPEVVAKRKADGITQMSYQNKNIDYEMWYVAWLARYAVASQKECEEFPCVPDHVERSVQIMVDRQPPWWQAWYANVTGEHNSISATFWALLYQRGMFNVQDFAAIARIFSQQLPDTFENYPDVTRRLLREIPAACELIHEVPTVDYNLFTAKSWLAVIEWAASEGLVDKSRLLAACLSALDRTSNQTERNGALILIKCINPEAQTLADQQATWLRLVADDQPAVAGFAITQLQTLEKAKRIDAEGAIAVLPHAFNHSTKSHALNAVKLLSRLAMQKSLRRQATEAVAAGLMHPNKDVQAAAIEALQKHLQPTDEEAPRIIAGSVESVSQTLRKEVEALAASSASSVVTTGGGERHADTHADLDSLVVRASTLPAEVRQRFRIDEAIAAAAQGQIDEHCRWRMMDMSVLNQAVPIEPIRTVEELVDVTASAVEQCDDPDTADRVLSGIARLCDQRPLNFEALTKPLSERACAYFMNRPNRGIVGGFLGNGFSNLISAWLGGEQDEDASPPRDPINFYLVEIEQRVRIGKSFSLLSEATHLGGWIDPRIWVDRIRTHVESNEQCLESDLVRSLLRLTPDGRSEAWQRCDDLPKKWKMLASVALGGSVVLDDSWSANVWFTALRARDPWIDLSKEISKEELDAVPEQLLELPDVVYPSNYQWRVNPVSKSSSRRGLVSASPIMSLENATQELDAQRVQLTEQLLNPSAASNDLEQLMSALTNREGRQQTCGLFTAELHQLRVYPAPGYIYPYFATQWPLKLDWYWCLATSGLSRRVESGSSVEERYSQFFLPMLDSYRPLCSMAARALWIASVSKDTNARSMAIEVWITLIGDDRCDVETLLVALAEVAAGGWVKFNRIGELMAEVARVSPLHAYWVASVLEGLLCCLDIPAKDVAKLLEPLNECCEQLGRSIGDALKQKLMQIKSGAAKATAKTLCERQDSLTESRRTAIASALTARIDRALACNP